MVMAGRIRLSFQARVLSSMLALCWTMVGVFMLFQYQREREFKEMLLDSRLQMCNSRIIDDLRHGADIRQTVARIGSPVEGLRVTVVGRSGDVVYDSNDKTPFPQANHNSRPEISEARANGKGHSVARHSESDDVSYFYSASLGDDGMVVRTAAPYTHTLEEYLRADGTMLWIMGGLAFVISLLGFVVTRKVSLSIKRLNRFAERAERGERIYDEDAFPHDELGSIASHIVKLYIQRDEQHREALRLEKDKVRLKRQLTNNINHELKTPVASIQVCLELLNDHPELDEAKKREFLDRIGANARRLSALLKDVSVITRMDEGAEMIEKSELNLSELIGDVVAEERLRTDMRILVDVPPLTVTGNRALLESIFRNLIDNAIAYSGASEMRIASDADGNFMVSDNGCGVAPEHLAHIFERFYRIDKGRSRASGGTGLGLSIVRNAVAIHGGTIKALSANGLTFVFHLNVNKRAT